MIFQRLEDQCTYQLIISALEYDIESWHICELDDLSENLAKEIQATE